MSGTGDSTPEALFRAAGRIAQNRRRCGELRSVRTGQTRQAEERGFRAARGPFPSRSGAENGSLSEGFCIWIHAKKLQSCPCRKHRRSSNTGPCHRCPGGLSLQRDSRPGLCFSGLSQIPLGTAQKQRPRLQVNSARPLRFLSFNRSRHDGESHGPVGRLSGLQL